MDCRACGYANRDGARFCGGCAAALSDLFDCRSCGTPNPRHQPFCDSCGESLTGSTSARRPAHAVGDLPDAFAHGRYKVQRVLGQGGRKRVYLAHDDRLDRDVAIAVLGTGPLDAPGLARLHREAQAMGRLGDHPNIVAIHDIGEEAGRPYIVSQYMAGGSVDGLLAQSPDHRLMLADALRIGVDVCRALDHAHSHGIVHRDLKPANVWLAPDGTAKLGDFGLAVSEEQSRLTIEGMMVGSAHYLSPEQVTGSEVDARTDLYSLGALLYEMICGRPPFLGDDALGVISQHLNAVPVAPSWHNRSVPAALETLVMRLLAKVPAERPSRAAEVATALMAVADISSSGDSNAVTANPLEGLAAGVFVGREREMEQLRARIEEALAGRGSLVLLVGEPGIGKTRTAEELSTYARLRGAQVLWGRCYDGEGAPAYWPWTQAVRAYVHDRDPVALLSEMGSGAADIGQVVSDVRERLPGLPPPQTLEPDQARFRLFDSIGTFLRNASTHQTLVIVLDDLQWADKPSLLLLEFLARDLRSGRLLVVGTYRDMELGRHHPLSQTLGELNREGASRRVVLRGLASRDVGRYMEITAGRPPADSLVHAVHRETEGNPLFVTEIVRLLASEGRLADGGEGGFVVGIPEGVREVIGQRLDRLSPDCNRALAVASAVGREFEVDLLQRVLDLPAVRLLEVLDEATAAQILDEVDGPPGHYVFAHGLIRQTLYDELPASRRTTLHRSIGEALEAMGPGGPERHLAELAHHFFEGAFGGGDVDKAVDYAVRAGERALAILAYEEAAGHYERALQALDLTGGGGDNHRNELLLSLGLAQQRSGDKAAAKETFHAAATGARRFGDPGQLARAALGMCGGLEVEGFNTGGNVDHALIALIEEALTALPDEDSVLRARLLGRLAVALYWSGDAADRRAELSQAALEMATRLGDREAMASALASRRYALWGPENTLERLAAATEVLRLANEAGDAERAAEGHRWRLFDLLELGDVDAVDVEIEAHARLAEELRQPIYFAFTSILRATRAIMDGRFEEGERLATEALNLNQRTHSEFAMAIYGGQMIRAWWEQGRMEGIDQAMRAILDQGFDLAGVRTGLCFTYSELGKRDAARAELEQLAQDKFASIPRDMSWLSSMAMLAQACATLDDADNAGVVYDLLLPYAGRTIVVGPPALSCLGPASHYLGMLATVTGAYDDAERHFADALDLGRSMRAKPFVAHTQREWAALRVERNQPGDLADAVRQLSEALAIYQELGMVSFVERAIAMKLELQQGNVSLTDSIDALMTVISNEPPALSDELPDHISLDGDVTVLFSDIQGFTELTDRVGDQAAQGVLRAHNAIVRQLLTAHGGHEVKSVGDGFMVIFNTPGAGVRCAIDMQLAFAEYTHDHTDEPLRVRVGLHSGEVLRESDDFFGRNVIMAARIASEARGCEILVSEEVAAMVRDLPDVQLDDGREVHLKGLAGKQRLHRIVVRGVEPVGPEPGTFDTEPGECLFRQEGDFWTIAFEGPVFRLKDVRGLQLLARLLQQPGQEVHAVDLETGGRVSGGRAGDEAAQLDVHAGADNLGPVLDERAKREYRNRLAELSEELEEAQAFHDGERASRVQAEIDVIVEEISGAVGLGGRDRPMGSQAERARVNVTRAIKSAIRRIGEHSEALEHHLTVSVTTGTFCCYRPDARATVDWQL